jgi:RNA polymerase sigma-70 factor (ECF subfamily)
MREISDRFEDLFESPDTASGPLDVELSSETEGAGEAENVQEFKKILAALDEPEVVEVDEAEIHHAHVYETVRPGEDEALVSEFFTGNESAFVQLYAKYETPLLHYCRRVMATEKLAEDAFQDCWMRIFELRKTKPVVTSFRGLLFKTARNLCLNTKRLEHYRAGTSESLQTLPSNDESSRSSEESEIKNLMTRALAKLPFEQREAFVLHEYSGYSYQEISVMIGIDSATIKVRAFRARIRLRKLIASWLGLAEDDDPSNAI